MLDATEDRVQAEPDKAQLIFEQRGGDRLLMYDNDNVTVEQIDKLISDIRPRIVVVDIADHVCFRGDSKVTNGAERLKTLYRYFRNFGKKYSKLFPIDLILTGWSDASTDGKKWFGQSSLDGGKTGKPGSTDVIICIGQEDPDNPARYLGVVRNKLTGKHMKKVCTLVAEKSRFKE
jgi:hypothetical protein